MKIAILVLFIATHWLGGLSVADDGYNEPPENIETEYRALWDRARSRACDHWLMTGAAVTPIGTNDYWGYSFPSGFAFSEAGIAALSKAQTPMEDPQREMIRWLLTTQLDGLSNHELMHEVHNSSLESKLRLLHARAAAAVWAQARGAEIILHPDKFGHLAIRDLSQSLRSVAHFDEEVLIASLRGYQPEHFARYLNEMYVIASDLYLAGDPWNALALIDLIEAAGQNLDLAQLGLTIVPALSLRVEIATLQVLRSGAEVLGFDLALRRLVNSPHMAQSEVAHPVALVLSHLARLYVPGTYGAHDVDSISPERKDLGRKLARLITDQLPRDLSTLVSETVTTGPQPFSPNVLEQLQSGAIGVHYAERNQMPGLLDKEALALIQLYTLLDGSHLGQAQENDISKSRQLN